MQIAQTITLPKSRAIPSLSDNSFLRYVNFIALYFAQGIPEGMLTFGIPA
jgi:PAT family beta-lactamase induction signal transducer AmpG